MQVEQLFAETLIDIHQTLGSNPSDYQFLKVAGLLRPILLEKLLDDASAAASLDVKFRVVKPGPSPIPPEVQRQLESYLASLPPGAPRPVMGFSYRGDLMTGEPRFPGDVVLELGRKDLLNHEIITWMDNHYTVENVLRVAANSLGGIHWGETNWHPRSEELRKYMEGTTWMGRTLPAAIINEIGRCTLNAFRPLAQELARLGLYSGARSEWRWSADGQRSVGGEGQNQPNGDESDGHRNDERPPADG
jgi:hypothetical protein